MINRPKGRADYQAFKNEKERAFSCRPKSLYVAFETQWVWFRNTGRLVSRCKGVGSEVCVREFHAFCLLGFFAKEMIFVPKGNKM